MFCYQCEQTAHGTGCTGRGVCGKTAETSDLQDLLVEVAAGVSGYARRLPEEDLEAGRYVVQALFATVTNVDFTPESVEEWIKKGRLIRRRLAEMLGEKDKEATPVGIEARKQRLGEDKAGLLYMIIYGLKSASSWTRAPGWGVSATLPSAIMI